MGCHFLFKGILLTQGLNLSILCLLHWQGGSSVAPMVKNLPANQKSWVGSLGWEDPLEKGVTTSPVFLRGKVHGQMSLASYSPWGHKESHRTQRLILGLELKHNSTQQQFMKSTP